LNLSFHNEITERERKSTKQTSVTKRLRNVYDDGYNSYFKLRTRRIQNCIYTRDLCPIYIMTVLSVLEILPSERLVTPVKIILQIMQPVC